MKGSVSICYQNPSYIAMKEQQNTVVSMPGAQRVFLRDFTGSGGTGGADACRESRTVKYDGSPSRGE